MTPDATTSGADDAEVVEELSDAEAAVERASIRAQRLDKVAALRERGIDPYPYRFDRDRTIGELRAEFEGLEDGVETDVEVRVAGRLMLKREQGRLTFGQLRDRSGEVQLFVSAGVLGKERMPDFNDLDRGDWVGVEGTVMVTRKGELSVKVTDFVLLSKAVRPLPDKWKGLSDVDTRFRQRYVDLTVNPDARRVFEVRVAAVDAVRAVLRQREYLEVETPMLHLQQGGATARPFVTHYNALDLDTYLRIALELPLKRLLVGGFERVFEIGRVFRNEGIDTRHNPEFTMLEAYEAFGDYNEMIELTEALVGAAAQAANGTTTVECRGRTIELAGPWRRVTMVELIAETVGVDIHPAMPVAEARAVLDGLGLAWDDSWGAGRCTHEVYDELVEPKVVEPTVVLDHPRETSPLAKPHRDDPTLVERFEVIVDGRELANAYSELNDPAEQLARFREEAAHKAAGDPEAADVDLDYIRALEYGMPPAGGMGMGIDRLVMLLAGVESIREVILFPTLRPEVGFTDADVDPA
ncbi:lysine--tRNA ligase [Rhabdothermincola salaria]|uniref:lysine--tRNA ligase n=1 Tax=Rhabdothermincola salaria TaxID=2903142 RepID=UPI001E28606F|nr:lysine--tRNA ligase [Rhabdothermincola salaria]MCD9623109.1 lysine--tRNA ligase [Rhabdothermincola salaria]